MRIHRLKLRNFRGIRQAEVVLEARGVTIIEGPNEVGKSSLAEAIDALFDKPDSSRDRSVLALKPVDRDEGAEVELEFSTGPYRLVYAKRWHKDPRTTLRVLEPSQANLTGREAHDRVKAMLDESLDRHLWGALRHQQGVAIAQAALDRSRSLAAALDAAASGAGLSDPAAAALWEAARAERDRYWTPGRGQRTKEREERRRELQQFREEVRKFERDVEELEGLVEEHARLAREVSELDSRLVREQAEADALRARVGELAARERETERLDREAEMAAVRLNDAYRAATGRRELVQRVTWARQRLEDLRAADEREMPAVEAATELEGRARAELERAQRERAAAERRHALARADHEYWRAAFDLGLLRERLQRVADAQRERAEAQAALHASSLDEAALAAIEAAWNRVQAARAGLEATGGRVRIEALADLEIELSGHTLALSAGAAHDEAIGRGLELRFPGLARVRVEAGEHELADELSTAEAELGRLCAEHGLDPAVEPVGKAREIVRRRREAEARLERSEQAVQDNLRDLTEEKLADLVRKLEAYVESYPQERSADVQLPADLPMAEAKESEAYRLLEEAQRKQSLAEEAYATARDGLAESREASVRRRVELEAAERNLKEQEAQLEAARRDDPDEVVEEALVRAQQVADEAEAAAQRERAALEAEDPASQKLLLANAEAGLERHREERTADERRLQEVATELRVRGESGLYDQLQDARARYSALEEQHKQVERRAAAAALLFDVLDRHRAAAKARYLGPLRAEIERLGRVVFGPSLSVELDPDTFEVESRTLEGVTVPYESLSTGAKEQLCLLGRLACARLVARGGTTAGAGVPGLQADGPTSGGRAGAGTGRVLGTETDAGVPVIIDDALGYSDPDRLERLGAVLAEAGREAQVLVLTCVPDRYRAVGSAKVVRLEPVVVRGDAGGLAPGRPVPAIPVPERQAIADRATADRRVVGEETTDPASLSGNMVLTTAVRAGEPTGRDAASRGPGAPTSHEAGPGEASGGAGATAKGFTEAVWRAQDALGDDAKRVLACLQQAARPLGKSEILSETALDEARWPATVRHLLEAGLVVQEGARRGARYRPANS